MNPQTPAKLTGSASISFRNPVYITSSASVVGKKEGNGPLGDRFDLICEEPMFGEDTWEAAESTMQKEAAALALGKAGLTASDIRMAFAGDLLAQTTASSFGIAEMAIPFYGLFGACSTMGESLSLGAMSIAAGYGTCLDGIIIDNLCDFRYNLVLYLLNGIIFTKICGDGCTTLKLQTEIQRALSSCSVTDHSNKSGYDHNNGNDKTYPAMLHEIDGLMFFCTSV